MNRNECKVESLDTFFQSSVQRAEMNKLKNSNLERCGFLTCVQKSMKYYVEIMNRNNSVDLRISCPNGREAGRALFPIAIGTLC